MADTSEGFYVRCYRRDPLHGTKTDAETIEQARAIGRDLLKDKDATEIMVCHYTGRIIVAWDRPADWNERAPNARHGWKRTLGR